MDVPDSARHVAASLTLTVRLGGMQLLTDLAGTPLQQLNHVDRLLVPLPQQADHARHVARAHVAADRRLYFDGAVQLVEPCAEDALGAQATQRRSAPSWNAVGARQTKRPYSAGPLNLARTA